MALDEPKEKDEIIEENGFKFLIDKELSQNMSKVNIDYSSVWYRKGFKITSNLESGRC